MIIENDIKLDFKDIMFKPMRSTLKSRSEVDLYRTFTFNDKEYKIRPIVAANMDTTGTFEMANVMMANGMMTAIHKYYTVNEWVNYIHHHTIKNNLDMIRELVIPTIGIKEEDLIKYDKIKDSFDFVCIDIANGYGEHFSTFIKEFKKQYPEKIVIAGNVATGDMTQELILSGASIIKVGIGPGSVCLTRMKTGVGVPQVSAIIECANVAHGLGGHIMADGGCVTPGDISKAFGCGADFIMLGGMLAGHDESGGDKVFVKTISHYDQDNNPVFKMDFYKEFHGMSSKKANDKYNGGLKTYRSSEGRETKVPYRGKLQDTIQDILGGISSTMTYIGARKLKDIPKCATFIRVTQQINNPYDR